MYYTYIMTTPNNTVLYTGMTNDLKRRVHENREKVIPGFTQRYGVNKLVHFEWTENVESAIAREKQIKNLRRAKKTELIHDFNKDWEDLHDKL